MRWASRAIASCAAFGRALRMRCRRSRYSFPNQFRIARERFRCRKFCRIKISPIAVLSTKSRDAAFSRNTRAGENENTHNLKSRGNGDFQIVIRQTSALRDLMLPAHARLATLAPMSKRTTEIASGAVREIEPELRELFTKIVERDPREAVKMLEPYPDEFVVKMLELLNPAATLKILQRFDLSRRETILATASTETNAAVDAQSNLSGTHRWAAHAAAAGSLPPDNDRRPKLRSKFAGSRRKRLSPTRS